MSKTATLLQLQTHADNVSHIEEVWWSHALAAYEANDPPLAFNIVLAGGQAEHFAADLDPDPAFVTTEESDELRRRLTVLEELVQQVGAKGYGQGRTLPTLRLIQVR